MAEPVPHLSVEVDDLDEALRRVRDAGLAVEYGPANEPWGLRRFVEDREKNGPYQCAPALKS
jgi:hypothetical protein